MNKFRAKMNFYGDLMQERILNYITDKIHPYFPYE